MKRNSKIAIIIGAGPAGLTAAYELLKRTDIKPVVIEKNSYPGGLSATLDFKGNKIDIGGHRFFTKSERVLEWWFNHLPLQKTDDNGKITYHNNSVNLKKDNKYKINNERNVFLIRNRRSRIYYQGKFFNYPITPNFALIKNLGFFTSVKIVGSYLRSWIAPQKENNLEDFLINRFGKELYRTFFKAYTEKVWGVECKNIGAEWGQQRIKGLSLKKVLFDSVSTFLFKDSGFRQSKKESSLIEKFLYPKYGPGQLWEKVANDVINMGGEIHYNTTVVNMKIVNNNITKITTENKDEKQTHSDQKYVFSTMPISNLMDSFSPKPSKKILHYSSDLPYRNLIVVGLIVKTKETIPDNWLYIHDKKVKVGRMQVYNNWSPYMVKDKKNLVLGMEYFTDKKSVLWNNSDDKIAKMAENELTKLKLLKNFSILDAMVIRAPKAYPSYTGAYKYFNEIKECVDAFDNLYLIGRNGMHKYNNQDHSMLTAMVAVDNIVEGRRDKNNIWEVNADGDYIEEK